MPYRVGYGADVTSGTNTKSHANTSRANITRPKVRSSYSTATIWTTVIILLLSLVLPVGTVAAEEEGTVCWPGSYYRRVVTHTGFNKIALTVVLPDVIIDTERSPDLFRPLDGFHIYTGGTAQIAALPGQSSEIDAGLAWEIARNKWGEIDARNFRRGWQPFFRTSRPNQYLYAPGVADHFWFPGEEVTLTFEVVGPDLVTLTVEGAGKTYTFDPVEATGFDINGNQLLKWVTSLDQSGLEGRGVVPTKSKVVGAHVKSVTLWTPEGDQVPLTEDLVNKPRTCIQPEAHYMDIQFNTKYSDEIVTIEPAG